jgi:hypothetical protein
MKELNELITVKRKFEKLPRKEMSYAGECMWIIH